MISVYILGSQFEIGVVCTSCGLPGKCFIHSARHWDEILILLLKASSVIFLCIESDHSEHADDNI